MSAKSTQKEIEDANTAAKGTDLFSGVTGNPKFSNSEQVTIDKAEVTQTIKSDNQDITSQPGVTPPRKRKDGADEGEIVTAPITMRANIGQPIMPAPVVTKVTPTAQTTKKED